MIGNFALTRINLAVAAALLALIGALFVVLQPAGAQDAVTNGGGTFNAASFGGGASTVSVLVADDGFVYAWADSTAMAVGCDVEFRVNVGSLAAAPADGTTYISVVPNGPVESLSISALGGSSAVAAATDLVVWGWVADGDDPETGRHTTGQAITVSATLTELPEDREQSCAFPLPDGYRLNLSTGDSDNIFSLPAVFDVEVSVLDASGAPSDRLPPMYTVSIAPTPAVYGGNGTGGGTGGDNSTRIIIGEGSEPGEYRLSALAVYDDGGSTGGFVDITIGNAGSEVGSVSLGFGYQNAAGACISEATADAATDDVGDPAPIAQDDAVASAANNEGICILADVRNSLGNPANDDAAGQIIAFAAGARVDGAANSNTIEFDQARGTGFKISRTGAGNVTLTATVSSASGAFTTNSLALTFSGVAETISLGEASGNLTLGTAAQTDATIDVPITAADAAGNSADVPTSVRAVFENAEGTSVSHFESELGYPGTASAGPRVLKVGFVDNPGEVPAGVYTMIARLGQETATATFAVAGGAASILLTADQSTGLRFGSIVTVTATIRDANGFAIADQPVGASDPDTNGATFLAAGNLETFAFTTGRQAIADGQSTGQFLVTGNEGQSVIIARVGDISTSIIITSAGASAAPVGGGVSLDCLSSLNNFSAWLCAESASASQIFDLVQARGATALHLWNGTAWVRYATVGGSLVPGSSNFTVDSGDVLYVSN